MPAERPARRRRAVGPPGAVPSDPSAGTTDALGELLAAPHRAAGAPDDDDRLRADRPPHHDRGV